MSHDTIVAIATALSPGAIGIVRISGPKVAEVLESNLKKSINTLTPRTLYTGLLYTTNNKLLDECCYAFFKAPNTYTGEDVLELHTHGSPYILKTIVADICTQPDCRLAKNGEFTKRAFLNGKIPLNKAQSIIDIIESTNEKNLDIALNQYQGHVYSFLATLRKKTLHCLEQIEASLEFPDEVGQINSHAIQADIQSIQSSINQILTCSDYGRVLKQGITYLIIGKPNVGKSSLLNCLSGENRSIVTSTPGTTRDYIDITISYQGMDIHLIDTAGLRDNPEDIEKIGIEKIKLLAESADGYIHVTDTLRFPKLPAYISRSKPLISVFNKIDCSVDRPNATCHVSCKTTEGIPTLKDALIAPFYNADEFEPNHVLSNLRQITTLQSVYHHLEQAMQGLSHQQTLDIIAIDLSDAIANLSNILGEDFTEDLLDGIFSNFCIGK